MAVQERRQGRGGIIAATPSVAIPLANLVALNGIDAPEADALAV